MPKSLQDQKRPADVVGNAVKVMRIGTGEEEEEFVEDGKDPDAKALGARGDRAQASKVSPEERSSIAKKAAAARWKTK